MEKVIPLKNVETGVVDCNKEENNITKAHKLEGYVLIYKEIQKDITTKASYGKNSIGFV